jgi:anti-sigma regulatory factor (Ser/Thr protein kinase)
MVAMARSNRIAVPTIDAVARCIEFAASHAREIGFSADRVREIELVVEEVVANVCRYSYGDELGTVEVCCEQLDETKLALEFIDYGRPFDILALPAPDLSVDLDQRDVGGIGVPMLRALIDQASYRREDARNVLYVIVHATPRLRGDPITT